MQFVFEDSKNSLISGFLRNSFSDEMLSSVHYTHGNSNICSYITESFDVNETICVFLDMPPGNLDIADIYGDLSACAQSYHSLFILPLVCMEYHFLSFVKEFPHLISVESWVNSCLSFGSASATIPPIIDVDNETELRRYAAFERFCKLVARKALVQCVRIGVLSSNESKQRPFYSQDCLCATDMVNDGCVKWALRDKAISFARALPFHPPTIDETDRAITRSELIQVHNALVSAYNARLSMLKQQDPARYCLCDPILPVPYAMECQTISEE